MGRKASEGRRRPDQGLVSLCHRGPALAALPPEIWPQFLQKKKTFPCRPEWLCSGHQTLPGRRLWLPSAIRAPGLVLRCLLPASCLVLFVCVCTVEALAAAPRVAASRSRWWARGKTPPEPLPAPSPPRPQLVCTEINGSSQGLEEVCVDGRGG